MTTMKISSSILAIALMVHWVPKDAIGVEVLSFPTSSPGMPGHHVRGLATNPDDVTITDSPYVQWDGHVRCCRDSDQNWSGSNSLQVWGGTRIDNHPHYVGMEAQNDGFAFDRQAIVITDGWLEEVPAGREIVKAEYEFWLRFSAGNPAEDKPGARGVRAYPLLVDLRDVVGISGNGRVADGEMTFSAKSINRLDPTQTVYWGDGSPDNTFGPVAGFDYDADSFSDTLVEVTKVDGPEMQYHRIDITPMAQAWHRGDLPYHGVLMGGLYAGDIVDGVDLESTSTLYYHGADAGEFGAHSELRRQERYFPVLEVTLSDAADSFVRQPGDANEDREVNSDDIIQVAAAGKYETGQPATWGEGDWNGAPQLDLTTGPPAGDGLFDSGDVVAVLATGLYETGPYAASLSVAAESTNTVPEPSTVLMLVIGSLLLLTAAQRQRVS